MINLKDMDAVILCGGLGTRLREEIGEQQKVMSDINGRPFLDILLNHLIAEGFERVILCTGYKADDIEEHYGDPAVAFTVEFSKEKEPLGTGGALKNAASKIQSDPFIVLNGDSYCPVRTAAFLDYHINKKADASIVLTGADQREDFGTVVIDVDQKVTAFKEKAADAGSHFINAGIYCFNKAVLDKMPPQKKFSLEKDFFPKMAGQNFYGYVVTEKLTDIGTPERFQRAKEFLK